MNIVIQEEDIHTFIAEGLPMIRSHYEEVAMNLAAAPFDPDLDRYIAMALSEQYVVYGARREGKLIGYVSFAVLNHPHSKNLKFATSDMIYLHPDYRNSGLLPRLLSHAETELVEGFGVRAVSIGMKMSRRFLSTATELGYVPDSAVLNKYIEV